jgi:hypothetical protein
VKLAICYSSKNQFELTEQTWTRLIDSLPFDSTSYETGLFWCDASSSEDAVGFFEEYKHVLLGAGAEKVFGGADSALAWKLTRALQSEKNFTHIMLLENDVLLDENWFDPTIELFEKGERDGLVVGAVSPRSYVDRILIQRDGWAVCHNLGAGCIILTREAADIVLRTFRTGWWPDNVRLFAQLSGIDLRTYAAFRGNEQWVTTDWMWDAQLARHGLAALACTPAKCMMIGQNPPLAQQGLELTTQAHAEMWRNESAFANYRERLAAIRSGVALPAGSFGMLCRQGADTIIFPHQLRAIGGTWAGTTELKWSQGFGPFAYRAGKGSDGVHGASLSVHVSGTCSFLLGGGDAGAQVRLADTRSGFNFSPQIPPSMEPAAINVPGGPIPRTITLEMDEGAVFYGLSCADPQMIDTTWKFDWSQLPEAT